MNDYFNAENPWFHRLFEQGDFFKPKDILQIEREFNIEKYGALLARRPKSIGECRNMEYEQILSREFQYISFKNQIFKTKPLLAKNIYESILKTKLEEYKSRNYCELGCGYGYNMALLGEEVYGGEYSKNAIKLANMYGLEVNEFNFHNIDDYSFIKKDSTIFTVDSVMYLSDAKEFINGLSRNKNKINCVVQFEPWYSNERHDLLGTLRNRYIEVNAYNKNLFSLLEGRADIEIIEIDSDSVSLNPLLPISMIIWKFK
jgi:hypothetical protein